jgi:hypothetical protein
VQTSAHWPTNAANPRAGIKCLTGIDGPPSSLRYPPLHSSKRHTQSAPVRTSFNSNISTSSPHHTFHHNTHQLHLRNPPQPSLNPHPNQALYSLPMLKHNHFRPSKTPHAASHPRQQRAQVTKEAAYIAEYKCTSFARAWPPRVAMQFCTTGSGKEREGKRANQ